MREINVTGKWTDVANIITKKHSLGEWNGTKHNIKIGIMYVLFMYILQNVQW